MSVTTVTAQTRGPRNWMQTVLITAGFALLVASFPQAVGAEEKHDPVAAATAQVQACESLGGTATVDTVRHHDGVSMTTVECSGGWLGGIGCSNTRWAGTGCYEIKDLVTKPTDGWRAPVAELAEALESGSLAQIEATLAAYESNSASRQGTARAADDQDRHQVTSQRKGKKGNNGKTGGKHRKR